METERQRQSEVPMRADDDGGSSPGANLSKIKAEFGKSVSAGRRAIERAKSRDSLDFLRTVEQQGGQ